MAYRVKKAEGGGSWRFLFKSQIVFWILSILIVQLIDIRMIFPEVGGAFFDNVLFLLCLYITFLMIRKILAINEKVFDWFMEGLVPSAFQDHSGESYRKKLRQHCKPSA